MRCPQSVGQRGSLKWIQHLINEHSNILNAAILPKLPNARSIEWRSPLKADQFAEYRDADFLERVGIGHLSPELRAFWPNRGPQWDGLARSDNGDVILLEAKAHLSEVCSPSTAASNQSRRKIDAALDETVSYLKVGPRASWSSCFYQLTNRLAHLYFLRKHGVAAWLVLVNFIGDTEMDGPSSEAEWESAYQIIWHVLGLQKSHALAPYIIETNPDVRDIPL
jgi:hypothetical protein